MIIFIDADGCPVVDETVHLANTHHIPCVILCDTSHQIWRTGAQTIIVSKGADSVDFALVNRLHAGDIAVTQDYGLAAMCLARGARVLRQDGLEYTQENIDVLLLARHTAKKIRRSGGRLHGNKKRSRQEDRDFEQALTAMITGENTHD